MSTTSPTTVPIAMPPFSIRRFSVDEYRRMAEIGVLTEDDRVELLEGWIIEKMTHNPPHDGSVELCNSALQEKLPTGWRLRIQSAIRTADSEPEPDVAVVRGTVRTHLTRHPEPDEIGLLVEVAESSLDKDREKRRIYARANIALYWIVNLVDSQVEVYSDPTGPDANPRYATERIYKPGQSIPLAIDGQPLGEVAVHDLLP